MARPKLKIDPDQVRKLAALHCTIEEMAAFFDCSRDTISDRFSAEINKGRQQGKMQLRDWQLQAAKKGNVAMLIFLGKQYLGQSDKIETDDNLKVTVTNEKDKTIERLTQMILDGNEGPKGNTR